eukprot:5880122-Amphidinium_carterae.3
MLRSSRAHHSHHHDNYVKIEPAQFNPLHTLSSSISRSNRLAQDQLHFIQSAAQYQDPIT